MYAVLWGRTVHQCTGGWGPTESELTSSVCVTVDHLIGLSKAYKHIAGAAQWVYRWSFGLDGRGIKVPFLWVGGGQEVSLHHRPWGLPSLLVRGYRRLPRLRVCGTVPPLSHASSWRVAQLSTGTNLSFIISEEPSPSTTNQRTLISRTSMLDAAFILFQHLCSCYVQIGFVLFVYPLWHGHALARLACQPEQWKWRASLQMAVRDSGPFSDHLLSLLRDWRSRGSTIVVWLLFIFCRVPPF